MLAVDFGQRPHAQQDGEDGNKLGNFDIGNLCADVEVQTVTTHTFDDQTCNTVENAVEGGTPTKLVVLVASKYQHANQKSKEGTNTFVEEGRLIPATACINPNGIAVELGKQSACCVGKFVVDVGNQVTVRLLVEEVAPTAH